MGSIRIAFRQYLALVVSASLVTASFPPPSAAAGSGSASPKSFDGRRMTYPEPRRAFTDRVVAHASTSLTQQSDRPSPLAAKTNPLASHIAPGIAKRAELNTANNPERKNRVASQIAALDKHGVVFVENKGQFDSRVKFQVSNHGKTLWLTENGIVFDFLRNKPATPNSSADKSAEAPANGVNLANVRLSKTAALARPDMERNVISENFVGAASNVTMETKGPSAGVLNYFSGSDPSKWQSNVHRYTEVVYHNLWKGIDLRLYGNGHDLEQEFVVNPGSDPAQLQVAYDGIEKLEVAADGTLLIRTVAGEIRESAPRIYQERDGRRVPVQGRFKPLTATSYGFDFSSYDPEYPLVVDPTVLYSTFLGGSAGNNFYTSNQEVANAVAVDASGNAYIAGYTLSADFPTTTGAFQPVDNTVGSYSGFVTKVNPTGSALVYSTYFNYTSSSGAVGIAVDGTGNAYITGEAAPQFPTTANAFSTCPINVTRFFLSGFLSVLSPTGNSLLYSTCFGDFGLDQHDINGLTIDSKGRAFVVGAAPAGGDAPTTPNAFQASILGGGSVFVTEFDPTAAGASSLVYATYLGPSLANSQAVGTGVAVDTFGKIYLAGYTLDGFPVTPGAFQTVYPPCIRNGVLCPPSEPAFIAKLDPSAPGPQSLIYATYLGGLGTTDPFAIAVDSSGAAYVTGNPSGSYYQSFPITPGAFLSTVGQNAQAGFVTKLNAAGSGLVYSTLLSGNSPSVGSGIVVDALGNAYVAGNFRAGGPPNAFFPTTPDAFQSSFTKLSGDFSEAFLTKLNPAGSALVYSTYLGGEGDDAATAVAVDQTGDAYVVGHTSSATFPVTLGTFQPVRNGTGDTFVTKFPLGSAFRVLQILPSSGGNTGNFTATISGSGFHSGVTVTLSGGGPDIPASSVIIAPNGLSVAATFNLQGAITGIRDVVVTNPGGTALTLPQAFTIVAGAAANVQIHKTGTMVVPGRATFYSITVSNFGNTDSGAVPIVENLAPWFTFVSSEPVPTSIRQAPKPFPPGIGGSYAAFVEWDIPSLPAGSSRTVIYTVILDPTFPPGQTVTGDACVETVHNLCEAEFYTCATLDVASCLTQPELCIPLMTDCVIAHTQCEVSSGLICDSYHRIVSTSFDPNNLTGSSGVGTSRWVSGQQPLDYSIEFANLPTATAPAQRVVVINPVDPNSDLNTLQLTAINLRGIPVPISPTIAPIAGANEFVTNLDLRPTQNLLVNVDVKLDPISRVLTWTFTSIDPTTGQPPLDPTIGFLPPGGDGNVFFRINPQAALPTGSQTSDQATIVFDANQPMSTQPWTNTIDNTPPTSQVLSLPATENSMNFTVQWSGTDVGSGIQDFTIYVSDNGGPFTAFQTNTTAASATFRGQTGHTYGFYSIARDLVGNIEAPKTAAEATTLAGSSVDNIPPITTVASSPQPNPAGWNNSNVTVTLTASDNLGGSGVKQVTYSVTGAQSVPATTVVGSSASFVISAEGVSTVSFFSTDNAGNVEAPNTLAVKVDKTPASITCGGPDGLWHASDVSIACTASDALSGLANPADASFSLSTSVSPGTETSNAATGTLSVCDVAGNCTTAGPITGNMVDKKPPTINVISPTAGASYLLNQSVNANYNCTDGGSGIATCAGTVASGSPIATLPVGSKTFTLSATDKVGNVAPTQTVSYSVTYAVCLLYDPSRAVQSGSTIPLKIQLCDANNADASSSTIVVHGVSLVQTSTNASEVLQSSGNSNPDNDFRFDPTLGPSGGYIFNLSTKGLATGSYQLIFTANGDASSHVLNFQVR